MMWNDLFAERACPPETHAAKRILDCPRIAIGHRVLIAAALLLSLTELAHAKPLFVAPYLLFDTGGAPASIAVADLDEDGRPDLVTANSGPGTVSVLLGFGDGTFGPKTDFATGTSPVSLAIADLDRDGHRDVVTADIGSQSVSVLLGNGDGTLGTRRDFSIGLSPRSVAVADLNADGFPDVVTGNFWSTVSVLLGNGDGTLAARADIAFEGTPYSVALGDLDGDGRPDLVVTNGDAEPSHEFPRSSAVWVLLGNGDGTFRTGTPFGTGDYPSSVTIGDVNRDGRMDVAVTQGGERSNTVSVLLGSGNGTLGVQRNFAAGYVPADVAIGDLNGDGKPDLVTANESVDPDLDSVSNKISVLLGNGDGTFRTATNLDVGEDPVAVAIADLDGNGRLDIAVANYSSHTAAVLLGMGDGTFGTRDSGAGEAPWSVAIGDLDGDARPDMVTANRVSSPPYIGTVSVLLGNGDGSFRPRTDFVAGSSPTCVAIRDLDGNGRPDLAVSGFSGVSVLLGNGDGSFGAGTVYAAGVNPSSVAVADLNADGPLDLAVANEGSNTVSVLLGRGDGTFAARTDFSAGDWPQSVACADLSGDGRIDLAVANYPTHNVSVLLGNGDGTFGARTEYGTANYPASVVIGDLNTDGRPDLAVANSRNVSVLLGHGDGTFAARTDYLAGDDPHAVAVGDFDADGYPDLAVTNYYTAGTVSLLPGRGDGTFGARTRFGTGKWPLAMASGDLNADGRPDLAVANSASQSVSVMLGTANGPPFKRYAIWRGHSIEAPAPQRFSLEGFRPNPSLGAPAVAFTLGDDSPAVIEVLDLAGRRVLRHDVSGLGTGRHTVPLAQARRLAPGVYTVRLHHAGRTLSTRGVVVR